MERAQSLKEKEKKSLILKTLARCKSLGHRRNSSRASNVTKSKSWPRAAPEGYVTVYVGPGKERVVIRTECVNHPLFKELLDEAEDEFGYSRDGPIELPCDVERFERVIWEMDEIHEATVGSPLCSFPPSPIRGCTKGRHVGYRALYPSRLVIADRI